MTALYLINKEQLLIGGAKRDRTADLYTASVALSQLSYGPGVTEEAAILWADDLAVNSPVPFKPMISV